MGDAIVGRQGADGGWSFRPKGTSWTEPTCFSLLALSVSEARNTGEFLKGVAWLRSRQRPDGAWAPGDGVEESTWVTALAILALVAAEMKFDRERAASWLLSVTGRESSFVQRLRAQMLGQKIDPAQTYDGWPWFPGAAAWVTPTALSMLALRQLARTSKDVRLMERFEEGREFLLARRCRDGGWNHGSTQALGYDSDSYPETTGVAVLALAGTKPERMVEGVQAADRHLQACRSLEAACWLQLGLAAHGKNFPLPALVAKNGTIELALSAMVAAGRNPFLS